MIPTLLKYLENQSLLTDTATVLEVQSQVDGRTSIILDQTIFYPQGGGQPYDKGVIKTDSTEFTVEEVRYLEGIVHHLGKFTSGEIKPNEQVELQVDEGNRLFNSRNHSAGHLIDVAIKNIGEHLTPQKGFHFPQGAYVEYMGIIDDAKKDEIQTKLQAEVDSLIEKNLPVVAMMMDKSELHTVCDYVPEWIPEGKPSRVVKIGEFSAHPCGGTHVTSTGEIKQLTIDKMKNKSGNTRISYSICQ